MAKSAKKRLEGFERPKTMKAAILEKLKKPLVVDEVTLPKSLKHGQVIVKVAYSGLCGSQLGEIEGVKGEDKYLPHLLGHEGSGVVMEIGPGVTTVAPGDAVVLHWREGAGLTAPTPLYQWRGKPLNAGWVTTFNEYAIVSENRITTISPRFDLKVAPLLGCAATTGAGIITNNVQIKVGESIVIFGVGGVGLATVHTASLAGAYPIIAVDLQDAKLEMAARFGATHRINGRERQATEEIQRILQTLGVSGGVDAAVDTTGDVEVIQTAYRITRPQGRTVLAGVPMAGKNISIHSLPLHFGKVLTGSHGGEAQPEADIPRLVRLTMAGRLNLADMVTDVFGLDEINVALKRMAKGQLTGRAIIDMEG